jgi:hypothetical protein
MTINDQYQRVHIIDDEGNSVFPSNQVTLAAGSNIAGKFGIDQTTQGVTNGVVPIPSGGYYSQVQFTRPSNTTAYVAGAAIGSNSGSAILQFANMGVANKITYITVFNLMINIASILSGMTTFQLNLFTGSPSAVVDGSGGVAYAFSNSDRALFANYIITPTITRQGNTLFASQTNGSGLCLPIQMSGTSLYGVSTTTGAYTPDSGDVFTLSLFGFESP